MGLDFVFQTTVKDEVYRHELNTLMTNLSDTYKLPRNEIGAVVKKRGRLYSKLISESLMEVGAKDKLSEKSALLQLSWDVYSNLSGGEKGFPSNVSFLRVTKYHLGIYHSTNENCTVIESLTFSEIGPTNTNEFVGHKCGKASGRAS